MQTCIELAYIWPQVLSDLHVDSRSSMTEENAELIGEYMNLGTIAFGGITKIHLVYPYLFLVKEIRQGIMTQETYPRESHCCCCHF